MKVLIADDHELVRIGLAKMLSEWQPGVEIEEAADASAVMERIGGGAGFDLVLLDLFMPGVVGWDLLIRVRAAAPSVPVLILSASESPVYARDALDRGAAGFVCKSAPFELMLSVFDLILAGGTYVPDLLLRRDVGTRQSTATAAAGRRGSLSGLTGRQQEVLALLGRGWSNKQIARALELSENTVKVHVASLLRHLDVSNRTEAVMKAQELGFDFPSET